MLNLRYRSAIAVWGSSCGWSLNESRFKFQYLRSAPFDSIRLNYVFYARWNDRVFMCRPAIFPPKVGSAGWYRNTLWIHASLRSVLT